MVRPRLCEDSLPLSDIKIYRRTIFQESQSITADLAADTGYQFIVSGNVEVRWAAATAGRLLP
jgi:hypothetical protein